MKVRTVKNALILAAVWLLCLAADAPPSPVPPSVAPSPAVEEYNDPGMHFGGPPGWKRIIVPPPSAHSSDFQPLAIFVMNQGKYEQRTLIIAAQEYEGTLDGFESTTENQLRSGGGSTIVDHKTRLVMANGMPAYWMKISNGDEAGKLTQTFQYAIFDGKRGIIAGVSARLGDVREEQARDWLSSLRVVLYPRGR